LAVLASFFLLIVRLVRPATPAPTASPTMHRGAGHETIDLNAGVLAWLIGGLFSVVLLVIVGMIGLQRTVGRPSGQPALTAQQTTHITPPLPHLQADPAAALARLDRQDNANLDSYAWLDPGHTRARIPITRAMQLLVGHSLDAAP
jgi:hypothetical protein